MKHMKDIVHCHALPAVIWLEHQVPVFVAKHLGCLRCGRCKDILAVGVPLGRRLCVGPKICRLSEREQSWGEENTRRDVNCCLSTSQRLTCCSGLRQGGKAARALHMSVMSWCMMWLHL